jgi:hypothetical protein
MVRPPEGYRVTTSRRRGRWLWFAGGFVAVFAGMLVFYPVIAMHPSGQHAVRERLWAFYADALPRQFGPSRMGPASSNADAFLGIAAMHLGISAVGGGIAAGVGWWRRRRAARAVEAGGPADSPRPSR